MKRPEGSAAAAAAAAHSQAMLVSEEEWKVIGATMKGGATHYVQSDGKGGPAIGYLNARRLAALWYWQGRRRLTIHSYATKHAEPFRMRAAEKNYLEMLRYKQVIANSPKLAAPGEGDSK